MTMRSVVAAIAARRTHGSWTDSGVALKRTWSHRKKPSQPISSASRARPTIVRGSAQSPKFGMLIAYRMLSYPFRGVGVSARQWPDFRLTAKMARPAPVCLADAPTGWDFGHRLADMPLTRQKIG